VDPVPDSILHRKGKKRTKDKEKANEKGTRKQEERKISGTKIRHNERE
jgi:hypothetical protein